MNRPGDWIVPDWPAPARVRARVTTRRGGVSTGPYASLNLGDHVGDEADSVAQNRVILRAALPSGPVWLKQVHSVAVAEADVAVGVPEADASVARRAGTVCAVLTADCLPLLLCDRQGTVVGAAHAGWRGLADGVIEAAVAAMAAPADDLLAWLGPAIGPQSFEVGDEVRAVFTAHHAAAAAAFVPHGPGKWLADLYALARLRLAALGVEHVYGGGLCTYRDSERFYSYRRDGATGRMASLVWLEDKENG
ncbi:MAG: peptidoglycan editing factor PgeF [Sulfuricellaceae bacterium]|nr:peptidoglycan editing factor PgeF [Sulfuricellaceae bacterium]